MTRSQSSLVGWVAAYRGRAGRGMPGAVPGRRRTSPPRRFCRGRPSARAYGTWFYAKLRTRQIWRWRRLPGGGGGEDATKPKALFKTHLEHFLIPCLFHISHHEIFDFFLEKALLQVDFCYGKVVKHLQKKLFFDL